MTERRKIFKDVNPCHVEQSFILVILRLFFSVRATFQRQNKAFVGSNINNRTD